MAARDSFDYKRVDEIVQKIKREIKEVRHHKGVRGKWRRRRNSIAPGLYSYQFKINIRILDLFFFSVSYLDKRRIKTHFVKVRISLSREYKEIKRKSDIVN